MVAFWSQLQRVFGTYIFRHVYREKPENPIVQRFQGSIDILTRVILPKPAVKFVIFAQGRSGSTLLESLLACHPKVVRATELLTGRYRKKNLLQYLDARSRFLHTELSRKKKSTLPPIYSRPNFCSKEVWGFKTKVYQLIDEQEVEPREFLAELHRRGWKIIYLRRRNLLRQAVSHFVRLHRGRPHKTNEREENIAFEIDFEALITQIEEKEYYLRLEKEILEDLPHLNLVYEDDLFSNDSHQRSLDKVFQFLDIPSVPVSTKMMKVTGTNLPEIVVNYNDIELKLNNTRHHLYLNQ